MARSGPVTYVNAIAAQGLVAAAELARALDDAARADAWDEVAAGFRDAVQDRLWDGERGLFLTSAEDRRMSLDGNALPVAFGWLDRERTRTVLRAIRARLWSPFGTLNVDLPYDGLPGPEHNGRVWPFLVFFEADARFASPGDALEAFELIERTWGNMLDRDPGNTFWEWVGPDGGPETPRTSLAHAWSAGVTTLLTERVLGVRVVAPRHFVVEPVPGALEHAQGRRPTPWGPLDVAWRRGPAAGSFLLDVELPPGVTLDRVVLPGVMGSDRVTLNGVAIPWMDHLAGARIEMTPDLGHGRLRFVVTRPLRPAS